MGNHSTNRLVLISLVALGGCSESANRQSSQGQAAPEGVATPATKVSTARAPSIEAMTPAVPVSAVDGSFSLRDGRPNYDALRAKYGEPNAHVVLNPRLTNVGATEGFKGVEVAEDLLTFPAASSHWLFQKEPGDVLICGTECGAKGLLRRITYVAAQGNKVMVGTSPGKISDLLQDGWVHIETPVRVADLSAGSDDPTLRNDHHPRETGSSSNPLGNIYKTWPGQSGISGSAFQTSMGLQYSLNFDLTASGGQVQYLSLYMSSYSSLAVATAKMTTINTVVTQDTTYSGQNGYCNGPTSSFFCGGDGCGNCCWGNVNGYTDQTITRHTTTYTSTVLTPVPFPPNPFPLAPQPNVTVSGPTQTYQSTSQYATGCSQSPGTTIIGAPYSNTTIMTITGPDMSTYSAGTETVTQNYNPTPFSETVQLPLEPTFVGIPGLVFNPELTVSVGASISYTGSMTMQANINFLENANSGVSYASPSIGGSGQFVVIDTATDLYDWPSISNLPNSSLTATGSSDASFSGTGLFGLMMNVAFNDSEPLTATEPQVAIARTMKATITSEFYGATGTDGGDFTGILDGSNAQSCNNSHLFADVGGNIQGVIDVGNLSALGTYNGSFASHSLNLPIPASKCPSCTYSSQCEESGEGYSCINGSCQPDGTTCLEGACNGGQAACGPTKDGYGIPCVAVTLTSGAVENCCDGQAQGISACALGSCDGRACGAGQVCNAATKCCEAGGCPNGSCGSCGGGYECDPTAKTTCCVPTTAAGCPSGECGQCTAAGTGCLFNSTDKCCGTTSCQYGACSVTSDCGFPIALPDGGHEANQLPMTCESGCCIPNNACATGKICFELPQGVTSAVTQCPGGGAEFSCETGDNANSPWCCQCANSPGNATCLNGHSCGSGEYCDTVGCCYDCASNNTVTDSSGDSCYTNGSSAGHTSTCPFGKATDAGTTYYCQ